MLYFQGKSVHCIDEVTSLGPSVNVDSFVKVTREPSKSNGPSLNEKSVFKIMGKSSEVALVVMCGQKLHPLVGAFLNQIIPRADKEQVCLMFLHYILTCLSFCFHFHCIPPL